MIMTEAKSYDTFAEFQTTHFMKCCKWWHEHWVCSLRFQGDYLQCYDIDWKVPGVVKEK
jgi:hypothetical protein